MRKARIIAWIYQIRLYGMINAAEQEPSVRNIILAIMVLFSTLTVAAHPVDPTETTYLGNEGIMVSDGQTKILFDPLFPNSFGVYQMVPDDIRKALMAGDAPYDNIDAFFVSHMHPDHFSVDEVILYLETHTETQLFAPTQAVEWMQEETNPENPIFQRVTGIALERLDAPVSLALNDITIDVVRIPHAGWPGRADISNLIWRVTLADGQTVMHMGDADPRDEHYAPHQDHWQTTRTDTAFPPYWFFTMGDGPMLLKDRLNAENAIGVHVPLQVPPDLIASGADYLHTPGEKRALSEASKP